MKDITDYLSNSTSKTKSPTSANLQEKKGGKINKDEIQVPHSDNSLKEKKKRKRKSKRKHSDPVVKDIVDLLSNSLCIISPNTSFNAESRSQKQKHEREDNLTASKTDKNDVVPATPPDISLDQDVSSSCNVSNLATDKKENEISKSANKVNAFQFMMQSRNKSIGQNSPGKEQSVDDTETITEIELKKVLSARKHLLQNWSDKKGAVKRKREEEEKEEMIKYKLQKRTKRMKRLLKADTPKDTKDQAENKVATKSTRKKSRRISSSSENTNDSVVLQDSNEIPTNSVIEVIEENALDMVLNEEKIKQPKQGLLNFFGVVNKTKKSDTVNEDTDNVTKKDVIKIKLNKPKLKKKVKSNLIKEESESNSSQNILTEEDSKELKREKLSKSKKRHKHMEESSTLKNGHKDNGDANFTPRSLKSWKMRIKISDDDSEKTQDEVDTKMKRPQRSKRISDYKLLFSDESSSEGKNISTSRNKKTKALEDDEVIICSDDESNCKKKEKSKPIKVAPVFALATPKPKLTPEVVQARKQFLMSGIPDSLKRTIEKQQSIEEREYDIFPSISHVQQKCEEHEFWNLSKPQLDLSSHSPPLKTEKLVMCASVTNSRVTSTINIQKEVKKVNKLKSLLNKIKLDNPNYPVYKSFRLIYEKNGKTCGNKKEVVPNYKEGKKRRSKTLDKSIEIVEDIKPETDPIEHAMWTEKYKPKCSDDIIGNTEGVKALKKWLEFWKTSSEEINTKKRKKREDSSSDSEFYTTDCDSRDSTKLPDNTIVIGGPYGSGKSTAIYAICNELGFNVIELNASSKRTGKRLLQELQEATQSHQVRKKKHLEQNFFKSKEVKEELGKKMCVLLVEDVDIVFEQDDGFISALSQLVNSSKRPVVLTTTDTSSIYVQRFVSQYRYVSFLPLSAQSLATWLQIVCLVEGLYVDQADIGGLLECNKGDVRKTLLQLQFWVQSGGQIVREDSPVKTKAQLAAVAHKLGDDEQEPCLEEDTETEDVFLHSHCVKSFEIFKHHKQYTVPYDINLGLLWWNIPNILNIKCFSENRVKKFKDNYIEVDANEEAQTAPQKKKLSVIERQKLDSLSRLYDTLAFTDVSFTIVNHCSNIEPDVKNYSSAIKDSLELSESLDRYDGYKDFVQEMTHSLVDGYVEEFNSIEKREPVLNFAVPEKAERRWRAKMHICEDVFLETLPASTYVERRAVALDYMPMLRNIARSENRRAANNTKRGNRFRNYLQSLGLNYNDSTVKLACNILIMNDF